MQGMHYYLYFIITKSSFYLFPKRYKFAILCKVTAPEAPSRRKQFLWHHGACESFFVSGLRLRSRQGARGGEGMGGRGDGPKYTATRSKGLHLFPISFLSGFPPFVALVAPGSLPAGSVALPWQRPPGQASTHLRLLADSGAAAHRTQDCSPFFLLPSGAVPRPAALGPLPPSPNHIERRLIPARPPARRPRPYDTVHMHSHSSRGRRQLLHHQLSQALLVGVLEVESELEEGEEEEPLGLAWLLKEE